MIDFHTLNPGSRIFVDGVEYIFDIIADDGTISLREEKGMRLTTAVTPDMASMWTDAFVIPVVVQNLTADSEFQLVNELDERDRQETYERLSGVRIMAAVLAANPNMSKQQASEIAAVRLKETKKEEHFPHARKSGRKAIKAPLSPRSIEYYHLMFENGGLNNILAKTHGSPVKAPKKHGSLLQQALAQRAMQEMLDGRLVTGTNAFERFEILLRKQNGGNKPGDMISKRTFQRWTADFIAYRDFIASRHGEHAASHAVDPIVSMAVPDKAFDIVEADNWKANGLFENSEIIDLVSHDNERSGHRCQLFASIDRTTKWLTAYQFYCGPPTQLTTMKILADGFRSRDARMRFAGTDAKPIPPRGIGRIVADGGTEFRGKDVKAFYTITKMEHRNSPAGKPEDKGTIEGFFRIVETGFFPWLVGQIGRNVVDRDSRAPVDGKLTVDELNMWFTLWVEDVYHQKVQWSGMVLSPREALRTNVGARLPLPSETNLREAVFVSKKATNNRYGVRFNNLHYRSEETKANLAKNGVQKVKIRVYEHDISKARVQLDERNWVNAKCVYPGLEGVSLEAWMTLNAACLAKGCKIEKASRPSVVNAVHRIASRMDELKASGKAFVINLSSTVAAAIDGIVSPDQDGGTSVENKTSALDDENTESSDAAARPGINIEKY